MIKIICKGMLVGLLLSVFFGIVNVMCYGMVYDWYLSVQTQDEANIAAIIQDIAIPDDSELIVKWDKGPYPEIFSESLSKPVVYLYKSSPIRLILGILFVAFIFGFFTWMLFMASKYGHSSYREHVLLSVALGIFGSAEYILSDPMPMLAFNVLSTLVFCALMGLAISRFVLPRREASEDTVANS